MKGAPAESRLTRTVRPSRCPRSIQGEAGPAREAGFKIKPLHPVQPLVLLLVVSNPIFNGGQEAVGAQVWETGYRHGARIVADGLGYTNEIQLDDSGSWLYVNETFGRRLSRFRVGKQGSLSGKETVVTFGHGVFPDGLTLDQQGGIWITSVVSNRVIRVSPEGKPQTILEDANPEHLNDVEEAFISGKMGRPDLDQIKSKKLRNISSLAFGGSDLRTVYLGCLLGDCLMSFRSPVAGRPPVHWLFEL